MLDFNITCLRFDFFKKMIWRHFLIVALPVGWKLRKILPSQNYHSNFQALVLLTFLLARFGYDDYVPGWSLSPKKEFICHFSRYHLYNFCHQRFGSGVNGQWLGMLTVGSGVVLLLCLLSAKLTGDTITWKTVGFFEFILYLLLICWWWAWFSLFTWLVPNVWFLHFFLSLSFNSLSLLMIVLFFPLISTILSRLAWLDIHWRFCFHS